VICGWTVNSLRADDAPPTAADWREQARFAFGHRATAAAFSPDGKTLCLAGGADDETGIVKLFDVATSRERLSLDGHANRVNAVAFAPDGKTLASGAGAETGGEVKFWDAETGKPLATIAPEGGYVLSLAYSPDGKTLAIGSGYAENLRFFGRSSFWEVASGRELPLVLQGPRGEVTAVAYVNAGKQLVTSGSRFDEASGRNIWEVKLWDTDDGKEQAVLFTSVGPEVDGIFFNVRSLAVSSDGKRVAGAGRDSSQGAYRGALRVWGVNPSADSGFLSDEKTPVLWSAAFSPDGKTLAVGGAGDAVRFWDLTTNREQASLPSFEGAAFCVAFSPDGKQLIAGGAAVDDANRQSGAVKWWTRP
jgi:WD40 repeat protein